MFTKKYLLIFFTAIALLDCSSIPEYQSGDKLFEDPLTGGKYNGWIIAPQNFVNDPEFGSCYQLLATRPDSFVYHPWVGDQRWKNYRIEVEFLLTKGSRKGFIGFQFHIQEDSIQSCNIGFYIGGDLESRLLHKNIFI